MCACVPQTLDLQRAWWCELYSFINRMWRYCADSVTVFHGRILFYSLIFFWLCDLAWERRSPSLLSKCRVPECLTLTLAARKVAAAASAWLNSVGDPDQTQCRAPALVDRTASRRSSVATSFCVRCGFVIWSPSALLFYIRPIYFCRKIEKSFLILNLFSRRPYV